MPDEYPHYPFMMHLCWFLNTLRLYWLAAGLRWLVWRQARLTLTGKLRDPSPLAYQHYDHPEDVGYRGWIEHPRLGVLAFVKDDGSLQFMW